MKPLLSVICYNRIHETQRTVRSLRETGAFDQADVVIWDNGSVDGVGEWLDAQVAHGQLTEDQVIRSPENVGCPRALNAILEHYRRPGQHFIKVDNDLVFQTPGWVEMLCGFLDSHPDVAMVGPWYADLSSRPERIVADRGGWQVVLPVIGHCVVHRGSFLDRTGYFDVLAGDHLYGFEDNLMARRAAAAGCRCAVFKAVTLENIQRHNSLDPGCGSVHYGERCRDHVDRLRPEYELRLARIRLLSGAYVVGRDGREAVR